MPRTGKISRAALLLDRLAVGLCLLALRGQACGFVVLTLVGLADEFYLSLSFIRTERVGLRALCRGT